MQWLVNLPALKYKNLHAERVTHNLKIAWPDPV